MKRKTIALLLTLVTCFSLAAPAFATENTVTVPTAIEDAVSPRFIVNKTIDISTSNNIVLTVTYQFNESTNQFTSISYSVKSRPSGIEILDITYVPVDEGTSDPYVVFTVTFRDNNNVDAKSAKLYKPF